MRGTRVDALRLAGQNHPDELLAKELLDSLAREGTVAPERRVVEGRLVSTHTERQERGG